jgi:molybdopterin converting factor small subunit
MRLQCFNQDLEVMTEKVLKPIGRRGVTIQVEFFGLARTHAGAASVEIDAKTLRDVVSQVQSLFPALSKACFESGELQKGWVLNINGRSFVRDLDYELSENDSVLLMSADVGG